MSIPTTNSKMSDQELIRALPGFENKYLDVNGTTLHVVEGGEGFPLLLLPGWPQTWWAYNKVMPILAQYFKVIAVDVRGMRSSSKPENGYDKKNSCGTCRFSALGFHPLVCLYLAIDKHWCRHHLDG